MTPLNFATAPMPQTFTDVLSPYQPQLEQYVGLLNQLGTLANRAEHLYTAVNNTSYDPANTDLQLSVAGVLNTVKGQYESARASVNKISHQLPASDVEPGCHDMRSNSKQ